jgi:glucose/arabinose dehydrogenase
MNRRPALGRAIGTLSSLVLTTALLASSCSEAGDDSPGAGATGGTGMTTGGTGGTGPTGGTGGTGGSSAGSSAGGTSGGTAPVAGTSGTAGTGGGVGGAGSGAGGSASGSAGTTAGTGLGGAGSGAGGTPPATGGASAGAAGSPGGAAGSGGSGGQDTCGFNGPRTPPPLGTWPPPNLTFPDFVTGVTQPTAIVAPRCGDSSRIYVAEKWGRVRLIKDGVLLPEPALDIRDAVLEGGPQQGSELMNQGKRGLVGLALHPNFAENGRMFVMYVADQGQQGVYGTSQNMYDDGDQTFAEYRRSASNPDVFDPMPVGGMPFLQFDKGTCNQCSQHNGGSLEVDVDGFLWASTGDPPPYSDPGSHDLNNLNGKLLRFDISGDAVTAAGNYPSADPYVASIGIRNAYKFSIDRYTGDVYVGDVGENDWEEVTVERYGQRNKDHEWPSREATAGYMGDPCEGAACLAPVFEYGHTGAEGVPGADNCIIGGYVYRGQAIAALQGTYLYGDNGSGRIRAIQVQDGALVSQQAHTFNPSPAPTIFMGCFGEDAAGELYVCDYNNNKILRVAAQ